MAPKAADLTIISEQSNCWLKNKTQSISDNKPPENCQNPTQKAKLAFKNYAGCLTTCFIVFKPCSTSAFTFQCIIMHEMKRTTKFSILLAITI
jgi:hypothetical protein